MWSLDPRARVSRHLWQFLERAPQSDLINNITIVRTQKREKYEIKPKSSIATGHSVKWPLLIMRTCAISGCDCVSDTFEQNDPGTLLFFDLHVPHTWNSRTIAQYKWPFHLRFGSNNFFRSSYQPNTTHSFCFVVCKEFSGGIPGCLLSRAINRGVCPVRLLYLKYYIRGQRALASTYRKRQRPFGSSHILFLFFFVSTVRPDILHTTTITRVRAPQRLSVNL